MDEKYNQTKEQFHNSIDNNMPANFQNGTENSARAHSRTPTFDLGQ
jgi:hypothetical protein